MLQQKKVECNAIGISERKTERERERLEIVDLYRIFSPSLLGFRF